jgi:chromosome segregation ATPase
MLRRYKIEIDDNILINNLDVFKAQLNAQSQYCDDVQEEIRKCNEQLRLREKKYEKLKATHKITLDKCTRLEYENAGLRSQIELLRMLMMNTGGGSGNHHHLINTPIVNNIQAALPAPQLIAVPPPVKDVSQNKLPMDNVLNELKNKIKKMDS